MEDLKLTDQWIWKRAPIPKRAKFMSLTRAYLSIYLLHVDRRLFHMLQADSY